MVLGICWPGGLVHAVRGLAGLVKLFRRSLVTRNWAGESLAAPMRLVLNRNLLRKLLAVKPVEHDFYSENDRALLR